MKPSLSPDRWKRYLEAYDIVLPHFFLYKKWLHELVFIIEFCLRRVASPQLKVLELGCGTGNLMQEIAGLRERFQSQSLTLTGIDLVAEALEAARSKSGNMGRFFEGNLGVAGLGMAEPVFKKLGRFHLVTMNNVFSFLSDTEKNNALGIIKKLLYKGGYLVISEPLEPVSTGAIIKKYFTTAGKPEFFKFFFTILPNLQAVREIFRMNSLYLEKSLTRKGCPGELFESEGFMLESCFYSSYLGSNTIEVLRYY